MRAALGYQLCSFGRATTYKKSRARLATLRTVEYLESRRLLSFLQPFGQKFHIVHSGNVVDVISIAGPGQVFTRRINRKSIALSLPGTTQDSQVTVTAFGSGPEGANRPLQVSKIIVRSGRLGSFQGLTTVDLEGRMSPLTGPISSLQLDSIGPAAKIDVIGNLGQLAVNRTITLGSTGLINVTNDLTGSVSVMQGDVNLDGGVFSVGRDLSGTVTIAGNLDLTNGGQFTVGRNLGATASGATDTVTGNLSVDSGSTLSVGGNLSTLAVTGNVEASGGGAISVAGNLGTLMVSGGGGSSATGNVTVSTGALIHVYGNMNTLSAGSNLQTSGGGEVKVGGDLGTLSVSGVMEGKGSEDVVVGDDLGQLTVLGGGNNVFSLTDVAISAGKNIQGLDVRNGITSSLITAGILINGGTPGTGSNGWNIGPDGPVAVFDSQILAGIEIENLMIGGNVESDMPSNPAGTATRIVAGEYPQNTYVAGGIIDKFQIIGNLIDAVVAASVKPYNGTYPEPAAGPNSTAPPFADPSVPMSIVLLGGSINPSFATSSGTPSMLTVTGAVMTSKHVYNADYAGIFAANTGGVKVGTPSA